MPIFKKEDIVGWESKPDNRFLCSDCFDESKEKTKDWDPISQKEVEDDEDKIYICDECEEEVK